MKKQESNINNIAHTGVRSQDKKMQPVTRNIYTEADLGEDILNVALGSVYSVVAQSLRNIYGRVYAFNNY